MPKLIGSNLDFNNTTRILNLPAPASANEPVRSADLNAAIEGIKQKDAARAATQGNLNLAAPGATLDGIALANGDRVLVRNQTAQSENGIYIFNGAAAAMTRAADANTAAELTNALVPILDGTDAGKSFRQTATNPTIGTSSILFVAFGTSGGVVAFASQAETDAGNETAKAVTPATLKGSIYAKRKIAADFGDGTATQFDVTHNLNTRDVEVEVYRNSGAYDTVFCDVERPDANTVRLRFAAAPTANQFRAVILG